VDFEQVKGQLLGGLDLPKRAGGVERPNCARGIGGLVYVGEAGLRLWLDQAKPPDRAGVAKSVE
jgi:hypothetical protein